MSESIGVQIGASPHTIKETRESILKILDSKADVCLRECALKTLTTICDVQNTTVKDSIFNLGKENK